MDSAAPANDDQLADATSDPGPTSQPAPVATYRLQFNAHFTLTDALQRVPYLAALGVSDLYASPLSAARAGSVHGYDVVDTTALNAEVGTLDELAALSAALAERGMGILLDIVPNHMCVADDRNAWWNDLLLRGRASRYATWFDIDWDDTGAAPRPGKVVLPILTQSCRHALQTHEITIAQRDRHFVLDVNGRHLPVNRAGVRAINSAAAGSTVPAVLSSLNAAAEGTPEFSLLRRIVDRQHYRLSDWRAAADDLNYRRFFDISDLAALRVEDPDVFDAVHRLPLCLARRGLVHGLRVDHVDGLRLPHAYLNQLRDALADSPASYLVVEKVLAHDETLPAAWPVAGTTGYDRLADLEHVQTDQGGATALQEIFTRFTGTTSDFGQTAYEAKKQIVDTVLASELHRLAWHLWQLTVARPDLGESTLHGMARALRELVASFPVYRTYRAPGEDMQPADQHSIADALANARRRNPGIGRAEFDVLAVLLLETDARAGTAADGWWDVVLRLQQLTGAAMAKGVEDTAFYRSVALASLNEVGDAPDAIDASVATFHARNRRYLADWPDTMVATSTHDTKRSEDVRSRLRALSEVPTEWHHALERWQQCNADAWHDDGSDVGRREVEYLLYQTLIGVWPSPWQPRVSASPELIDRIQQSMEKAVREARRRTSWRDPVVDYELGVHEAIGALLSDPHSEFLISFATFLRLVYRPGHWSALAEMALKFTMPGVPDVYQGCETWNYLLVDPDNRRPVDFDRRAALLASLDAPDLDAMPLLGALAHTPEDDRSKLWLTSRILRHRQRRASLYRRGEYVGLDAVGPRARHVVAFARRDPTGENLTVAGRYFVALMRGDTAPIGAATWRGTEILVPGATPARYRDVISGQVVRSTETADGATLSLTDAFGVWPIAVLERLP